MIGHTLGPYRIAELISRSARSEVYRAVDTSQDDRVVALKLVNPTSSGDPRYVARFRREAEKAATVVEPHIVPVHRYGAIDGRLFVDMQLVEGRTLGEILTHEGALAAPRIVALLGQVGAALDAAHAQGSVHGYLTPAGVMVTGPTDGRPEFAHLVGLGVAETDEPGTTAYTAPERSPARPAAPSADVYSLTCVLYELLTGARPHPDTGYSQRRPPPRPSSLRGDRKSVV